MKRIYRLLIFAVFAGCTTRQPDESIPATDSSIKLTRDSANVITDTHYFYNAEWDQKLGLTMKKVSPLSQDSLTPSIIVQRLNSLYPDIQLYYKRISSDTIFTGIKKSRYLTRQIGSTGAKGYLAEVTFNLTEIPGVNFVDIDFSPGDHASPGTYSRTDFIK